jgi:hypothetical protein
MFSHVTAIMGYIYVLIRVFRYAGALPGVLGALFGPYVFVWGWLRAGRYDLTRVMRVWSGALLVALGMDVAWLWPVL